MPWKVSNVMQERVAFVVRALGREGSFSRLCAEFGISRPTGYRWLKRYLEVESFTELKELSRRPHNSPRRTPEAVEQRVLAERQRFGDGARKLRILLLHEGVDVPERTIHRILRRHGHIPARGASATAHQRFERPQPNQLWQIDFKGEDRGGRCICHPFSVLDDHSRFLLGLFALPGPRHDLVLSSLRRCFDDYGLPEALLMDHGTPWWSNTNPYGLTTLAVTLIEQGIRLIHAAPGHPQTQGKVERLHGSLQRALNVRPPPHSLAHWQTLLDEFRLYYNHRRPHQALDMAVPATRYGPSPRRFQDPPPAWDYPSGLSLRKINPAGLVYWKTHYFVSESLAGRWVGIQEVDGKLLVQFRHQYIREINLATHKTRPFMGPPTPDFYSGKL